MRDSGDWREVFRPDLPSPARVYDYLLDGKDHYPADRVVADNLVRAMPDAKTAAIQNRAFLGRAVRYLAAEAGVRQFLDVGTGLPNKGQVHEIVQAVDPACRVLYVDNDPVVLAHARDMLHGNDNTAIIRQDLREPQAILGDPHVAELIDFDRPVAVLLVAVLHFIAEADDPRSLVAQLVEPLPSGSYLVISHLSGDGDEATVDAFGQNYKTTSAASIRTKAQVLEFFDGLDLIQPELVWTPDWRPDPAAPFGRDSRHALCYGGVARKP